MCPSVPQQTRSIVRCQMIGGGRAEEAGKARQTVSVRLSGEELPPHKVPLLGRFYGNAESQSSQGNAFYSNSKRINEVEGELKGRRKDGLPRDEFRLSIRRISW